MFISLLTGTIFIAIEGYVIVALNIHEEATEEDVEDFFEDYGKVKNLHLNLDRQSGYVKVCVFLFLLLLLN